MPEQIPDLKSVVTAANEPSRRGIRGVVILELELDVQLSRDGHAVLFHDGTLERKLGRTGAIRDYTLAELQQRYR